ncbi:MAG: hypothetical protein D6701_10375, partial [Gemmatimonadetes bacterium]
PPVAAQEARADERTAAAARVDDARTPGPPADLFAARGTLRLTLRTDVRTLRRDRRGDEPEYLPAALLVHGEDDTVIEAIPLRVRTRGNFRRTSPACWFPPVRLNFRKKDVPGTAFHGQDKLKLVTHCRERDEFEQNVLEEFLAYRWYNEITDASFRVRLVRITYADTTGRDDDVTRYGFLIEDEDRMAERLGGEARDLENVHPAVLDGQAAATLDVFQYLIGNTDWSAYTGHNVKFVRLEGRHVPVGYDFDFSGLVEADYARPDPSLRIGSVRQRLFRGFCRPAVDYEAVFRRFLDRRERLYALAREQEGFEERSVRRAVEYLDDFFEVLDDPGKTRKRILEACREL